MYLPASRPARCPEDGLEVYLRDVMPVGKQLQFFQSQLVAEAICQSGCLASGMRKPSSLVQDWGLPEEGDKRWPPAPGLAD
jgi:hypothetical protein